MKLTLIKDYANYFNRNIKRNTYSEITSGYTYKVIDKINFITGDDIRTSQVLNWSEEWDPNYLIVSEDGSTDIKSRWFIIDHTRTRKGQYDLTLKRDLICENYDNIITSPAYIERGILSNTSDPAVFNSENVSTNQIKQWERPIMETDSNGNILPFNWIVGYCNPQPDNTSNWDSEEIALEGDVPAYATWNDFPYASLFNTSDPTQNKDTKANLNAFIRVNFVIDTYGSSADDKTGVGMYISAPSMANYGMYQNNISYTTPSGFTDINKSDGSKDFTKVFLEVDWPASSYPQFDDISRLGLDFDWISDKFRPVGNTYASFIKNIITNNISDIYTASNMDSLVNSINNTTVKINDVIYKISISKTSSITDPDSGTKLDLYSYIREAFTEALNEDTSSYFYQNLQSNNTSSSSTYLRVCYDTYTASMAVVPMPQMRIQLKGVGAGSSSFKDVAELNDAPYAMFAIPYFNEWYTTGDLGHTYSVNIIDDQNNQLAGYNPNNKISFAVAQYIVHQLQPQSSGSGYLIDLQLLPYCPFDFTVSENQGTKYLNIISDTMDIKNVVNVSTNTVVCSILFAHESDRERNGYCFDGTNKLNISYSNINDLKVANQCDIYRLNSPSKSKYYDFNAAKNYGLNSFNICTTYKPFSPFIYIRPNKNTNSLYGQNFNDYIGLIATGDYALPIESDAWKQYQVQNKNYQQIFDRQIQHQTFLNNWAVKEQEYANKANIRNATVGGALSGGLTGAMTGAKVGGLAGPYGAIGGALIGGIGGAFGLGGSSYDLVSEGAQLDMDRLISTNAENIAYAKDTFNYNLQNIQALPDTLLSTSSFDYINKVYPFIEYYTCTDIEKEQVRGLLTLQGMSVNKVATIDTLTIGNGTSYTKASLYRFIGDTSNPVIVNEINAELIKGVYL
jgi:hypothetical protein